jgi:8-oxo-dGTP pyrophosphatase MutT (NUDIX family)
MPLEQMLVPKHERPTVLVSAVIRRGGKYLLTHEEDGRYNFLTGRQENGEDPTETIRREAKEEIGAFFRPLFFLGVYSSPRPDLAPDSDQFPHYVRIVFLGEYRDPSEGFECPPDIKGMSWFTAEEIRSGDIPLRALDIAAILQDHECRTPYPLEAVRHIQPQTR